MINTLIYFAALVGDILETRSDELARKARIEILKMTSRANASHVGSALSVIDILSTLYSDVSEFDSRRKNTGESSKVILSKGHAASALYAVLAIQGWIPDELLKDYCKNGAQLGGHVTSRGIPAVTLSTGSLGHGLPYGVGISMAKKLSGSKGRTYVVMSDGECDEGTTWESALLANHHNLSNLCVIIDRNNLQSLTTTEETLKLEPFFDKWVSFGWLVRNVDGHDYGELRAALIESDRPLCVIANTTKGKGISFMENSVLWHYRPPNVDELKLALKELGVL